MEKKKLNTLSEQNNARTHLLNNYNYFIGKLINPSALFERPKVTIFDLLNNGNQRSNLFTYNGYSKGQQVMKTGQELKDEITQNPGGHTAKDLHDFFNISADKDQELILKRNPFYKLAQQIFIYFHSAAKQHFINSMKQLCNFSPTQIMPIKSTALTILGVITFLLSTFTTGFALNHYLQENSNYSILSLFQGDKGAIFRVIAATIVGCLLSYIIIHLKVSLYRSILSTGKVIKGIKTAYFKYPWTMLFSTLMLLVSFKTNYDGGVALLSKSQHINQEHAHILKQTTAAFAPINESVIAIKQKAQTVITHFNQFPLVAAKDTTKVTSKRVDAIMQASGLDFKVPIETKITAIVGDYENTAKLQLSQINKLTNKLDNFINSQNSLLPTVIDKSFVGYYDINDTKQQIAKSFNVIYSNYSETITKFKTLIDQYAKVLRQIEQSDNSFTKSDALVLSLPSLNSGAMNQFSAANLKLKHMSYDDLTHTFKNQYGVLWAQFFMVLLLVLSVLIDLVDIILLAPNLAKQGKKESEIVPGKQEQLHEWEDKFLKQCFLFFDEKDVLQVYSGLIPQNSIMLVDSFYHLLEEINPQLIDPLDKSLGERIWDYVKNDFRPLHTLAATDYNERVEAIQHLILHPDYYLGRYLDIILPHLDKIIDQADFTFDELDRRVQGKQNQILEDISKRMNDAACDHDGPSMYLYYQQKRQVTKLHKDEVQIAKQLLKLSSAEVELKNKENKLATVVTATNMEEAFNVSKLRKLSLIKEQERIKQQLEAAQAELDLLQIRSENYLLHNTIHLSKFEICKKMLNSFLCAHGLYSTKHKTKAVNSRRKWLSMINGHSNV
ncbi:MAG: hypothetical protein ISR65_07325 [Bacteriovoracaceae bacterium]|nr:hypothetical protein [Bacteriovoracaceae bacterium]